MTTNHDRKDIARVTDWIELELDKANASVLGPVREKLIEALATISGRDPQEVRDILDDAAEFDRRS